MLGGVQQSGTLKQLLVFTGERFISDLSARVAEVNRTTCKPLPTMPHHPCMEKPSQALPAAELSSKWPGKWNVFSQQAANEEELLHLK